MIVAPSADLEMALRAIVFSAVGTAGQRCTSLRRLIVHEDVYDIARSRGSKTVYRTPRDRRSARARHAGRSADRRRPRSSACSDALAGARSAGRSSSPAASARCETHIRTPTTCVPPSSKCRRRPTIVQRGDVRADPLRDEIPRRSNEAIAMHNDVPQGLVVVHLHDRRSRSGDVPVGERFRLRHRQRQHRTVGRRDRRRVRRREGHRRRPRIRFRRVEGVHAPPDQHGQLLARAAAGAGHQVRDLKEPAHAAAQDRRARSRQGGDARGEAAARERLRRHRLRQPRAARAAALRGAGRRPRDRRRRSRAATQRLRCGALVPAVSPQHAHRHGGARARHALLRSDRGRAHDADDHRAEQDVAAG